MFGPEKDRVRESLYRGSIPNPSLKAAPASPMPALSTGNEKDYWSTSMGSPLAEGCGEVGGDGGGSKIGRERSRRASTSARKTFGGCSGGNGKRRWI